MLPAECPRCNCLSLRCKVELFLDIDMRVYRRLSKKTLRTKFVRVEGANWPTASFYCTRTECGYAEHLGRDNAP